MAAIKVSHLTKKFKNIVAVDDISFQVDKGSIFAFLGPNGAGKSTTIKMMTTILSATGGTVEVGGFDAMTQQNEVRKSIGVIFQDHTLDDELTAYENMLYHCALYGVPKRERKDRIESLLESIGLPERRNELIKTFSGGMKRRVEIARGLLHAPKILFLDEPTLGLDVQTRSFLWKRIRELNETSGITVFFTTHNLDEAERIATKIAVIDQGRLIIQGTADEIKAATSADTLENAFLSLTGYDIRDEGADSGDFFRRGFKR